MNHSSRFSLLALVGLCFVTAFALGESAVPAFNHAPKIISAPQPVRPLPVFHFGTSGMVEVAFTIMADGSVDQVKIHRSTDALLDAPVLTAIRQWKFSPAVKNGRAVALRARQTFTFDAPGSPRDLPESTPTGKAMVVTAK